MVRVRAATAPEGVELDSADISAKKRLGSDGAHVQYAEHAENEENGAAFRPNVVTYEMK